MTDAQNLEVCPGCGARFPKNDGPTHRYLESTAGCWAAYGEVLAREYSDPAYFEVHHRTVDAYSVQHPGSPTKHNIKSVVVHLIGLYAGLERQLPRQQVAKLMDGATKQIEFDWLNPPENRGDITVADVLKAQSAEEHRQLVPRWAREAWMAWSDHHQQVEQWFNEIDHFF